MIWNYNSSTITVLRYIWAIRLRSRYQIRRRCGQFTCIQHIAMHFGIHPFELHTAPTSTAISLSSITIAQCVNALNWNVLITYIQFFFANSNMCHTPFSTLPVHQIAYIYLTRIHSRVNNNFDCVHAMYKCMALHIFTYCQKWTWCMYLHRIALSICQCQVHIMNTFTIFSYT